MKSKIRYARDYAVGSVTQRLYGSFIEHMTRCVYGGVYEPSHPTADATGFRNDVKAAVRDAGVKLVRYPGGNFVSGYCWKDGIGPRERRPVRPNLAWNTLETNEVGTDEMLRWCRELNIEPMMTVNLGTGLPREAAELVEYCNVRQGTAWSDLRRENGTAEPYGVRLWCLGNEMDGSWQLGNCPAGEYAQRFREAALLMRRVDPGLELVACGSSSNEPGHRSFGVWDRTVLEAAYEEIDYLSLHRYYGYDVRQDLIYPRVETLRDGAYMGTDLEELLKTVGGAIDYVKGIRRSAHEVALSLDELSLLPHPAALPDGTPCHEFTLMDAVLYGGLLCVVLNHADRVKIQCQSLLVNENGLYTTLPGGGMIPQSIVYPYRDFTHYARGVALLGAGNGPLIETDHFGQQPGLRTACTWDEDTGALTVFAANAAPDEPAELTLDLSDFDKPAIIEHLELAGPSPDARNTCAARGTVQPSRAALPPRRGNAFTAWLRPCSWNVLRFRCENKQKESVAYDA